MTQKTFDAVTALKDLDCGTSEEHSMQHSNGETNVCHYIIAALSNEGASHVFMVPGGFVDNFSQALVDVENIHPIVAASEAGAAMMADGFARASGRFGVCMGISGPGVSNMLTALSASMADQIPVLVISGDTPLGWRNRDAIQDSGSLGLKSLELMRSVSKAQYEVYHPSLLPDYVRRSTSTLNSFRTGPVHLSIPMDIQKQTVAASARTAKTTHDRVLDTTGLSLVAKELIGTQKIACLIGAGIRKSNAFKALKVFIERFHIPVATTMSAKGDLPEDHPLSLGVFGWAGSAIANETLIPQHSDLNDIECLIVIGSKLGQISSMGWSPKLNEQRKLIHIDINPEHFNQNYDADLSVMGDARSTCEYLANVSLERDEQIELERTIASRKQWLETLRDEKPCYYDFQNTFSNQMPIHPARAIIELQSAASPQAQVFVDNGAHTFFATHYWNTLAPNHFFNIIKFSGAMGWSIPASIGAKMANPERPTVAITGDGCMLMHGIEIQTAARYKLKKMVFVVLNNCAHGNPKLRAEGFTDDAAKLTDIVDHDWAAFAESLGVIGLSVDQPEQLHQVFEQAFKLNSVVLVDVKCGLYPTPTKVFDQTFMRQFNSFLEHKNIA